MSVTEEKGTRITVQPLSLLSQKQLSSQQHDGK
jgi:hypothetical protein